MWRSLSLVPTELESLIKSIWFKSTVEAHDSDKSTSTRQHANGYLVCLFQVVSRLKYFIKNSQMVSRSTHKWYPTSGIHEDSKCLRNGFYWQINHTRGITFLHVVSIIQEGGSTSDPQL